MGTTTHRASQLPEPSKAHRAAMAAAEPVAAAAAQSASGVLTREILAPAAVVVLGAIMTILDATIVNVALPSLGADLHTSIPVIQWVPTVYLLAFAAVIPLTGWAAARFGAKTVWLTSLGVFMTGSLLAGGFAYLLPVARFAGLAWLITAGALLPKARSAAYGLVPEH